MDIYSGGNKIFQRLIESKENFDMNEPFTGIRMFDARMPVNGPSMSNSQGVLISFRLNEHNNDTIQLVISLFGSMFFRSYNASSGKWVWSNWKQIR